MAWKALRMAATQIAARTTAMNTAVITMRAPTKRMVPITAVRTKATLSARPGPVTDSAPVHRGERHAGTPGSYLAVWRHH